LDLSGLINKIIFATANIDAGRKGFATKGKAEEGRINFENGISSGMSTFIEIQISADPLALLFAEYAFITQELELAPKFDKDTINSLKRALHFFDDAFLTLDVVDDKSHYQSVDKTYPHDTKYRYKGYPKDSFHIAVKGHITRLQNILKTPGLDPIEKDLLKQRLANMKTAREAYAERQKKVLADNK